MDRDMETAMGALRTIASLVDDEGRYGDMDAVLVGCVAMGRDPNAVRVADGQADEILLGYTSKLAREALATIDARASGRPLEPMTSSDDGYGPGNGPFPLRKLEAVPDVGD